MSASSSNLTLRLDCDPGTGNMNTNTYQIENILGLEVGRWIEVEVRIEGGEVAILVDGEERKRERVERSYFERRWTKGMNCLLFCSDLHHQQCPADLRKLDLRNLPSPSSLNHPNPDHLQPTLSPLPDPLHEPPQDMKSISHVLSIPRSHTAWNNDQLHLLRSLPCPGPCSAIHYSFTICDQGFGNRKGRVFLVLTRGPDLASEISREDLGGLAPHEPERMEGYLTEGDLFENMREGLFLSLAHVDGGGGGHSLTISDLLLSLVCEGSVVLSPSQKTSLNPPREIGSLPLSPHFNIKFDLFISKAISTPGTIFCLLDKDQSSSFAIRVFPDFTLELAVMVDRDEWRVEGFSGLVMGQWCSVSIGLVRGELSVRINGVTRGRHCSPFRPVLLDTEILRPSTLTLGEDSLESTSITGKLRGFSVQSLDSFGELISPIPPFNPLSESLIRVDWDRTEGPIHVHIPPHLSKLIELGNISPPYQIEDQETEEEDAELPLLSGASILPEYLQANEMIVVDRPWLTHTSIQNHLNRISLSFRRDPGLKARVISSDFIRNVLDSLIRKAYPLGDPRTQVDPFTNHTIIECFQSILDFLPWRKAFFVYSIHILHQFGSADLVQAKLSEVCDRALKCNSAKLQAFNLILVASSCQFRSDPPPIHPLCSQTDSALLKFYECFEVFLDGFKLQALNSAFLEPSRLYFHSIGDDCNRDHVDIHGINWYLALIQSTLGIRFPLLPEMKDTCPLGLCDFWKAFPPSVWETFSSREAFGLKFELIPTFRSNPTIGRRPTGNDFPSGYPATTPSALCSLALDPSSARSPSRLKIRQYLERLAYFFTRDFFVPKCFEGLMSESRPELVGARGAMETLYEVFKREILFAAPPEDPPPQCLIDYCYQDEFFSDLNLEHTHRFFVWLRVCRSSLDSNP